VSTFMLFLFLGVWLKGELNPCYGQARAVAWTIFKQRFILSRDPDLQGRVSASGHRSFERSCTKLERKSPLPRSRQNPVAIERQRRHAGEAAATRAAFRPRGPAHDADDRRRPLLILEHGRAGIAGAGAKPGLRALPGRIDETNLQRAGLAGRRERR